MHHKHILLVEDNIDEEMLAIRALKKNDFGCEIASVRDGKQALDFMFAKGEFESRDIDNLPCFILLDLQVPIIDGLSILKKLREHDKTKNVPVIVLTSSKELSDINAAYEFGANSYVIKPISFNQFVETANKIGSFWLTINEVAYA